MPHNKKLKRKTVKDEKKKNEKLNDLKYELKKNFPEDFEKLPFIKNNIPKILDNPLDILSICNYEKGFLD